MGPAREWFTATEAAAMGLPDMPTSAANILALADKQEWRRPEWAGNRWRKRAAAGGGCEFHWSLLPPTARLMWCAAHVVIDADGERQRAAEADGATQARWDTFVKLPASTRDEAARRLQALDQVVQLTSETGRAKTVAVQEVARAFGTQPATIYNWQKNVCGVPRLHWLPYLAPHYTGRTANADCSPEAWDWLRVAFLRPEKPRFSDCYADLKRVAAKEGWTVPSCSTMERRMKRDVPFEARVLGREGVDELKRRYPAQRRDRSTLHAMEAVNADGHKIDVFVKWGEGEIIRPMLIVFQDLYSGKILSWRVDRSENLEAVRLAFGDMIEAFGVPDHCTLDNTRTFASKRLTGGMPNRFRFKVKTDEPAGIMTMMGIKVHWSTPYSGQSKPIERAFGDFAQAVAKHPAFAGAYVGNSPMAKPENYGSKAVPLDEFLAVVSERIAEHNARLGRRSAVCGGVMSFDDAFEKSYTTSVVRKASEHQRRLWLMACDDITVRIDGIHFCDNRYWDNCLVALVGQKLSIRFDPDVLQEPVHIYRLDGSYVGAAQCIAATGFYDADAAREHARKRRTWLRAKRAMLDAERSLSISEVAALMPRQEPPPPPEAKVVRPVFGNTALAQRPAFEEREEQDETMDQFIRAMARQRAARGDHIRLLDDAGGE